MRKRRTDIMKNKIYSILLSLSISLSLIFGAMLPIVSFADEDIIYISNAREFIEFSKSCSFDAWSRGKSFALSSDISLEGEDFSPVPSFSGIFDGMGYTVSGVTVDGAYSPAGLFSVLLDGAVIKNLRVEGAIAPSGDGGYVGGIVGDNSGTVESCVFTGTVIGSYDVGGIVGINQTSGTVKECSVDGEIIGENRTGGIAGSNAGLISSSQNRAKVNTISVTPELTLDELNISLTLDITKLPSMNNATRSDTGGISGYSTGIIMGSENYGEIGYKHIGYNVGGIAGRSSGHLANNENSGDVYGRKDVGGIVGHMEPYISYNLSEDLLSALKTELDGIHQLVNDAANAADEEIPAVSKRIDTIIDLLGDASNALDSLLNSVGNYGDELISEINRTGAVLDEVLSQLKDVTAPLPEMSESISSCLVSLEAAVESLDDVSSFGKTALSDMQLAVDEAALAAGKIGSGVQSIKDGLTSLSDAVVINDEAAMADAIQNILAGLTEISGGLGAFSGALSDIAGALEGGATGGEIADSVSALAGAFLDMSNALSKVADGVESVASNSTLDFTKIGEGLTLIGNGLGETVDAAKHIENTLIYLSDTIDDIEGLSDALDVTVTHAKASISQLNDATKKTTDMLVAVNSLVDYLNGVDPIQIPLPRRSIRLYANKLFFALSDLEDELKGLNADITVLSGSLTDTVRKMNESFSNISDNIVDMIYGLNEGISVDDDISEEEIDSITNGKVFSSNNSGSVYGDINVGGICGAMGLEYELDPEDDMSGELSVTQKKQYQLKAVIHACVNSGDVTSKRDSVGGIVGKMDFGLVYGCESYCDAFSESGSYVGGIAGISAGRISDSFAKGSLSGNKYIGGILGSGVTEDFSGDSSLVRGCYSMVEIISFSQYAGAIAGINAGEFEENYFVSDTLAGIDRISYESRAAYISYEDLIKRRHIPNAFYSFTLEFIADGEVIKSVNFNYGDSFDSSVFPEVPKKSGHYGYWDTDKLENLKFDTKVSAVYKPYVTAIGSEDERDGKNIFLVEGEFTENDEILLEISDNLSMPSVDGGIFLNHEVVERWTLTISGNGGTHNIHFLPQNENCIIYLMQNGEWIEAQVSKLGSYLTFDAAGSTVEIVVLEKTVKITPIVLISAGALVIIAALVLLLIFTKKKKKQKK